MDGTGITARGYLDPSYISDMPSMDLLRDGRMSDVEHRSDETCRSRRVTEVGIGTCRAIRYFISSTSKHCLHFAHSGCTLETQLSAVHLLVADRWVIFQEPIVSHHRF